MAIIRIVIPALLALWVLYTLAFFIRSTDTSDEIDTYTMPAITCALDFEKIWWPLETQVFFDKQKYDLAPEAVALIAEVSKRVQTDKNHEPCVLLIGNADATEVDSLYISAIRARWVAKALESSGIDLSRINVTFQGNIEANAEPNPLDRNVKLITFYTSEEPIVDIVVTATRTRRKWFWE